MTRNPVIRSSLWSIGGFGVGQFLRLGSNLVMTRLLVPEDFGLMAILMILVIAIELFSDLGIGASVIQNKSGEREVFFNTAWTIKVIRGGVIFLCMIVLSVPFAWFYNEPQLRMLLPVIAFSSLFTGFASNAPAVANRKLWLGRSTVMNFACQFLSICVMVTWAWFSPTVWALVVGNLASSFTSAVLSHFLFPQWRARFRWDPQVAREIIHFGKWMFLTSALTFLAIQIDRLTLAKLMPFHLVGIYSIGFMWATLPFQVVQMWMSRVLFPFAADIFRTSEKRDARLTTYRRRMLWLSTLGIGLFGGLITPVYRLIYTPEYWPATEFLQILLLGVLIRIIDAPYRTFNLALGQPKFMSIGAAATILIFAGTVYPLYVQYSAYGVAIAYSISQLGSLFFSVYGVRRNGLADLTADLSAVAASLSIWGILFFSITGFDGVSY